jgi:hypothetical protein
MGLLGLLVAAAKKKSEDTKYPDHSNLSNIFD